MKLKKRLYGLKELPVLVQIPYGVILILGLLIKLVLKVAFRMFYAALKIFMVFYEKKISPLLSSINDFLYHRACAVFDYEEK